MTKESQEGESHRVDLSCDSRLSSCTQVVLGTQPQRYQVAPNRGTKQQRHLTSAPKPHSDPHELVHFTVLWILSDFRSRETEAGRVCQCPQPSLFMTREQYLDHHSTTRPEAINGNLHGLKHLAEPFLHDFYYGFC